MSATKKIFRTHQFPPRRSASRSGTSNAFLDVVEMHSNTEQSVRASARSWRVGDLVSNWQPSRHRRRILCARGFTLVEVLVAVALLGLVAGGAIWSLTQANNYAAIARLYTGAETAAQNQIDYLLTDSPFNPQSSQFGSTNEWAVGSTIQAVTIYTEPAGADNRAHAVTGQMTTTITSNNVVTKSQNLNLYSATVVVTYTYRSKSYRVQLNAMRASDV